MRNDLFYRLDKVKWNKFHTTITVALGIGWMLDSFEATIIGNIIGVFKELWHLSPFQQSLILSEWLFGIMIGSYVLGYFADRFGRRRLFLITLSLYGTFTLLSSLSWNFGSLFVLRLITAIGIGAEYSAIMAAISEFLPSKYRGKATASVMNFWSIGPIFASAVTLLLINKLPVDWGWRVAFGFGALISLTALIIRRFIPESPRWLIDQGDIKTATAIVENIEQGKVLNQDAQLKKINKKQHNNTSSFFKQSKELITKYPGRVLLGAILDDSAGYYGLFAFLPIWILPTIHLKSTYVPYFYLTANIGGLLAGIVVALLIDRIGRKLTVPIFFTLAAFSVVYLTYAIAVHSVIGTLIAFSLAFTFNNGSWIAGYVTFSELFPTHLRSTGIGLSVGLGKLGGVFAPLILTAIASAFGAIIALSVLSVFFLAGALAMIPWYFKGVEGKGTSLEDMVLSKEKTTADRELV